MATTSARSTGRVILIRLIRPEPAQSVRIAWRALDASADDAKVLLASATMRGLILSGAAVRRPGARGAGVQRPDVPLRRAAQPNRHRRASGHGTAGIRRRNPGERSARAASRSAIRLERPAS